MELRAWNSGNRSSTVHTSQIGHGITFLATTLTYSRDRLTLTGGCCKYEACNASRRMDITLNSFRRDILPNPRGLNTSDSYRKWNNYCSLVALEILLHLLGNEYATITSTVGGCHIGTFTLISQFSQGHACTCYPAIITAQGSSVHSNCTSRRTRTSICNEEVLILQIQPATGNVISTFVQRSALWIYNGAAQTAVTIYLP